MIEIRNKEDCCGCTACESICPKQCITMKADAEGFKYPVVNKSDCIDCHLCEKKCPVVGKKKVRSRININKDSIIHDAIISVDPLPMSFICFINDNDIRSCSTSGGAFTAIANYVLNHGGIVYGAALDENQKVVHMSAESTEELGRLRRSKYVQSSQSGIYEQVKKTLKNDRYVLYTGTPCQVSGLKSYLGQEYKKLITVDIFCHGVGSPLYWNKYVQYMQCKYKSKIKEVRFREKTYGYGSATLAVYFESGKSSHKGHDDDLYWSPFSKNFIYRPSCYACAFKYVNHISDFSIGDFWDSSKKSLKFVEANGCSLMLCHTSTGRDIIKTITDKKTLEIEPINLEEALIINGGYQPSMLVAAPPIPEERALFMKDMHSIDVRTLNKKYMPLSVKQHLKCILKPILYHMDLLNILKKLSE